MKFAAAAVLSSAATGATAFVPNAPFVVITTGREEESSRWKSNKLDMSSYLDSISAPASSTAAPEPASSSGGPAAPSYAYASAPGASGGASSPYVDAISEECDTGADPASAECAGAITNYLDALGTGAERPTTAAAAGLTSTLAAASSPAAAESSASGTLDSRAIGAAIVSYLDDISSGSVEAPSAPAVQSYLRALQTGVASSPASVGAIASSLEALASRSDPGAATGSERAIHAVGLSEEVAAPAVASYLDTLNTRGAPRSSTGSGVPSYLDSVSATRSVPGDVGAGAGPASYLDAISEACDAGEPTVECADSIADLLDDLSSSTGAAAQPPTAAVDWSRSRPVVPNDQNMNVEKDFNQDNEERNVPKQEQSAPQEQEQEPVVAEAPNTEESQDRYLKMLSTEVEYKKLLGENPYALTDIAVPVLIQRALDNLEDSLQKNNGKIKGQSKLKGKKMPAEIRPTVLVLGTGWAAHAFIKLASTYDLRIVVVSPVNHFVFTPMLASAAVGTVEYRSMTEAIRTTNPFIDNFVEGRAIGVDVPNKKLTVQLTSLATVTGAFKGVASTAPCRLEPDPVVETNDNQEDASRVIELNYDYLVCAVGTSVRSTIVPGAKEHCFNLKTSQDSKRLRTAIGEALEYASRPDVQEAYYLEAEEQQLAMEERKRRVRFVVVGGGPTGVELAGELSDFISEICREPDGAYQHLAKDISVVLVHGGSELLPAMDKELRQRALAALQSEGVEVRLNTRLKEVGRDFVRLGQKGSDEEETIPVGLTVWAAGNAPVPFVQELLSQLPESAAGSAGRINVDRWLRCPTPTPESFGSVLVLGDVACLEAESKYNPPTSLPQTAQVAGQQGAFTARMLNRGYDLQKTPPKLPETVDEFSLLRVWLLARGLEEAPEFTFLSLGLLAYVGGGEALNQVQLGDVPIFNYAGEVAFLLWRSVYLTKQAATRNQALILFDWLRTEAFGRDITRL